MLCTENMRYGCLFCVRTGGRDSMAERRAQLYHFLTRQESDNLKCVAVLYAVFSSVPV